MRQMHGRHIAAAAQLARQITTLKIFRVGADDGNRRQTHNSYHRKEETDAQRGDKYALARFLGIGHGEEAHQDVGQSGGAKHQTQRQRYRCDGIGQKRTRCHQRNAFLGVFHRLGGQRF